MGCFIKFWKTSGKPTVWARLLISSVLCRPIFSAEHMLELSPASSTFPRFNLNTINCTVKPSLYPQRIFGTWFREITIHRVFTLSLFLRFIFCILSLAPLALIGTHQYFVWGSALQLGSLAQLTHHVANPLELHFSVAIHFTNFFNTVVVLLVDDLSLVFIGMTVLIISLLGLSLDILAGIPRVVFGVLLLFLEYFLVGVFAAHDFISFFFFFEATLAPMFLMIVLYSSGANRTKAAYWLAMFTLGSSIFFILPVIWLFNVAGITTFIEAQEFFAASADGNTASQAFLLCLLFFISFAIKAPVMPLHIWLPEVHGEAPTIGSMVLASLLLKLGGYGIIRICLGIFPVEFSCLMGWAIPLLLVSLILSAATAIIQTDTKKIVAYSSIAHMSVALVGLGNSTEWGYLGAVMSMFAHSLTSPALFFLVGCLYERYSTRNVMYFGGLARVMPLFSLIFFLFVLSNTSFPGFINFVGEVNVLYGFVYYDQQTWQACIMLVVGIVAVAAYNFLLLARLSWGNVKVAVLTQWVDLFPKELAFLVGVLTLLLYWGVYFHPLMFFISEGVIGL